MLGATGPKVILVRAISRDKSETVGPRRWAQGKLGLAISCRIGFLKKPFCAESPHDFNGLLGFLLACPVVEISQCEGEKRVLVFLTYMRRRMRPSI